MLSHGNLTSAVSIYDVWGKPARAERDNPIERVICVLPLFHIFALTVVLLSSLRRGHLISLHQRFEVEAVMRDIEVKRATAFPGVPTMWIAIASTARSRQARSVVAGQLRLRRRAAAGRGRQDFRAQGRHEAEERLGHDRDLLARHRPSQGGTGKAGLDRADAAGHRDGRGRAGRSRRRFCRPARSAKSASAARTSPRATGTGRRRPPRPSSATAFSPAISATWTPTAISTWSTARRT